ncbi:hypothetical protein [Niallia sp.]|uniref:hypothetical protein n=1 Tax=Niallia sp. TaxID=2837523 RepID=UPI00289C1239|nr:hypothetical protein [Niallia sp.]
MKKRAGEGVCYFVGDWLNEKVTEKQSLSPPSQEKAAQGNRQRNPYQDPKKQTKPYYIIVLYQSTNTTAISFHLSK